VATTTEHPARPGYGRLIFHGLREAKRDHVTNVAAALAYYGFLAVPSALLVLLGVFTLVAQPSDVTQLLAHLKGVIPDSAISLLEDSLVRMTSTQQNGGLAMIIVGLLFALWTLTGAMTTLMWALNIAFDREESRGFVRQRLVALAMLFLVLLAAILAFVLLVLGPHLQGWVGDAIHQRTAVTWVWWIAEWPILLAAMLVAFVGVLYLGPSGTKSHRGLVPGGGDARDVAARGCGAAGRASAERDVRGLTAARLDGGVLCLGALGQSVEVEAGDFRDGRNRRARLPQLQLAEDAEREHLELGHAAQRRVPEEAPVRLQATGQLGGPGEGDLDPRRPHAVRVHQPLERAPVGGDLGRHLRQHGAGRRSAVAAGRPPRQLEPGDRSGVVVREVDREQPLVHQTGSPPLMWSTCPDM
jgi:uncharacterized BrkB/YihY/UPF0761 family membrane protein